MFKGTPFKDQIEIVADMLGLLEDDPDLDQEYMKLLDAGRKLHVCMESVQAMENLAPEFQVNKVEDLDGSEVDLFHYEGWAEMPREQKDLFDLKMDPKRVFALLREALPINEKTKEVLSTAGSVILTDIELSNAEFNREDKPTKTPSWIDFSGVPRKDIVQATLNEEIPQLLRFLSSHVDKKLNLKRNWAINRAEELADALEGPDIGFPAKDPTHGADSRGRPTFPPDSIISEAVFVSVPSILKYPAIARYSYYLKEWLVEGITANVEIEQVAEWWHIPEAGSGIKQPEYPQEVKLHD